MRTSIVDGHCLDRYIPKDLKKMFYNHPMPEYKYATHDGFAPYGFSTKGLVLYLPLWALKGSSFKSVDAYKHTCTPAGTTWSIEGGRYFGGAGKIDCGDSTALDLQEMTLISWVRFDAQGTQENLIARDTFAGGLRNFILGKLATNFLQLYIFVAGAGKFTSHHTAMAATTFYHCAATYNKVTLETYLDTVVGTAPTVEAGDVDNKDTPFLLGARSDGNPMTGYQREDWIYNRAFTQAEITEHFEITRWPYK